MRKIFPALLVLGLGLIGPSHMSAAPIDAAAISRAADAGSLLSDIRHVRGHRRGCYHKCYREFVIGRRVCRTFC